MSKQSCKKFLVLLVLFSFLSTNVLAQDNFFADGQNALNDLISNQLDLFQSSKTSRSTSKKIGSSIKRLQSALNGSESSCNRRLEPAITACSRSISSFENKGCDVSGRSSCISQDIVDEFLPNFEDAIGNIKDIFLVDDDGDGVFDICNEDPDEDGVDRESDNCPLVSNPLQEDTDENGIGDLCDLFICCDASGAGNDDDPESCSKKTISQCREDEQVIINCITPIEPSKGKSNPNFNSLNGETFPAIGQLRREFNQSLEPTTSSNSLFQGSLTSPETPNVQGPEDGGGGTETDEEFIDRLSDAIDMSDIPDMDYTEGYMCADFSDDMQQELEGQGFNSTFTVYWYNNGMNGHAIVDVHAPSGGIIFIEPQTGDSTDLDFNGDGKVSANVDMHSNTFMATDDSRQIEVYMSRDDASMAGVPLPSPPAMGAVP